MTHQPGTPFDLAPGSRVEVITTLYHYDQPVIFVGRIVPEIETGPTMFLLHEDDETGRVVYLAAHVEPEEIDALKADGMPVRDAFRRDGTMLLGCSADLVVTSASGLGKADDVPEEWLPAEGLTLHPPDRRP